MKRLFGLRCALLVALAIATIGAGAGPGKRTFVYQDAANTPNGTQQNVTAEITVVTQSDGSKNITLVANDKPPVSVTIPANGQPPAPTGSPSPQRAAGMLILQRLGMLAQIAKSLRAHVPVAVQIPVLPPGALQPLTLPATLTRSSGDQGISLSGTASVSTTATVDPQKAKIKGLMPARRLAERLKNAATPSHVTLPDQVTATVTASVANRSIELNGTVDHALTAKGETTTITETWSIKPTS
jgi:hypothetical protein